MPPTRPPRTARRSRVLLTIVLLSLGAALQACGTLPPQSLACGSVASPSASPGTAEAFADHPAIPLCPVVKDLGPHGTVALQGITYKATDGTDIPALLALPPAGHATSACVIYQPPLGQNKEDAAPLWPGAVALGIAVFTIDTRDAGARPKMPGTIANVVKTSPTGTAALLHDTVVDLRRGVDYLETRPECHHSIGYFGTSLGGILGALLCGDEIRIRACALASITATWQEALSVPNPVLLTGIAGKPGLLQAALQTLSPLNPAVWVPKISPRPVMLIFGRNDPYVPLAAAQKLAADAREPKTVLYHDGGHDPFAGPQHDRVATQLSEFLVANLLPGSPAPASSGNGGVGAVGQAPPGPTAN